MIVVALHPEGVDRNLLKDSLYTFRRAVALHPEGVDRNIRFIVNDAKRIVALHPEGVDRNTNCLQFVHSLLTVALHPEGVDRNRLHGYVIPLNEWSPSTRRAWIEILRSRPVLLF